MSLGVIIDRAQEVEPPEYIWVEGKNGMVRVPWKNRPKRRVKARIRLYEGAVEFGVTWDFRRFGWQARTPLTFVGKTTRIEGVRVFYHGKEVPLLVDARKAALGLIGGEKPGDRKITGYREPGELPKIMIRPVRHNPSGKLAGLLELILRRDGFDVSLRMAVLRGDHGLWLAWPTWRAPAGMISDVARRVDMLRFYLPDGRNITGEMKAAVLLTWKEAVGSDEPVSRKVSKGASCMTCHFRQVLEVDGRIKSGDHYVEDRYYCGLHGHVLNPVTSTDLYEDRILPELEFLPKVGLVGEDLDAFDVVQINHPDLLEMLPEEMLGLVSIRSPELIEMKLDPEDDESLRDEIARALNGVAGSPERETQDKKQSTGRKWAPLKRSKFYDLWGSGCSDHVPGSAPAWPVVEAGQLRVVANGDLPEVTIPVHVTK